MALSGIELIYNLALSQLGEYNVTEGQTSTKQYKLCQQAFPQARQRTLRAHPWNEAIARKIVPEDAYSPVFEFDKRYARPTDALKVISIGQYGIDLTLWQTEKDYIVTNISDTPQTWTATDKYTAGEYVTLDSITYECLVSNTAESSNSPDIDPVTWNSTGANLGIVYMRYIFDYEDTTTYSADLENAIALQLAILVSTALINDVKTKNQLIQEFEQITMPKARSVDAQEGKPRRYSNSSWNRSRSSGVSYSWNG
jgi:hypothetical protein